MDEWQFLEAPNKPMDMNYHPKKEATLHNDILFIDIDENDLLMVGSTNVTGSFWEGSLQIFSNYTSFVEGHCSGYYNGNIINDGKLLSKLNLMIISECPSYVNLFSFRNSGGDSNVPVLRDSFECFERVRHIDTWVDQTKILTCDGSTVRVLEIPDDGGMKNLHNFENYHTSEVLSIAAKQSGNDVFVSCSADRILCLWDIRQESPASVFYKHGFARFTSLSWEPVTGNVLAAGCATGDVYLFDARNPDEFLAKSTAFRESVRNVSFSQTQHLAIVGDTPVLKVYNCGESADQLNSVLTDDGHKKFVRGLAWSGNTLYSSGFDRQILKRNLRNVGGGGGGGVVKRKRSRPRMAVGELNEKMAESCSLAEREANDSLPLRLVSVTATASTSSSNSSDADDPSTISTTKQECASPSPTETLCLEPPCPQSSSGTLTNSTKPINPTKSTFLNELGLEECCEEVEKIEDDDDDDDDEGEDDDDDDEEDVTNRDDVWEDCQENGQKKCTENCFSNCRNCCECAPVKDNLCGTSDTPNEVTVDFGVDRCTTPKTNRSPADRYWRKRKLDVGNGFPSKKVQQDEINGGETSEQSVVREAPMSVSPSLVSAAPAGLRGNAISLRMAVAAATADGLISPKIRSVIPTKDNPPPEMSDWLLQFQRWTNAERLMAINELIATCEPTQVRHMMQVIEPQFQRDFISLLPRELALLVLSFLEPRDLLRAAQTCRNWRFLVEDNLLWKEKCREAGIDILLRRRSSTRSPSSYTTSPWKAAYMRQHAIEMNWRSKPVRQPKMLKGHDDHVITCLQFCGNRIVSGSDDNTLKVWSATSGKCLRTLVGHTGGVWSSQMSGSTIISGSTDRTLRVWDVETGTCIHTLYGHTSTVRCMHLHEHKVVSGSRDATLRVWDIESGDCLHVLVGHQAAVRCVQYDGRLVVSGAYDCMVKVWNPESEECLHTLQGHTNRVYSLQFDGVHVVSGSLDTSIRVWEVETGACRHTLMGHQSLTSGMELRNNILVSGNADSTVKVWDIVTGQCLQTLSGPFKHQSAVTCLQFNNRFVITSSDDGTVKLWDVRTGEFIRNLVALDSGGSGGVVWRIRASDTKLVCAVGSRNGTEETKLLVLDFDVTVDGGNSSGTASCGVASPNAVPANQSSTVIVR